MKMNHKQVLYNLLETMVAAAESNSKKTLIKLNKQYETELNKTTLSKRNDYHQDYDLLRNSCMCSIYPAFQSLRDKLIQDAQERFSKLSKP